MWEAKSTGNMTLAVLDETGFQIVKVDMLSYNTMKAGTEGDILAKTMNDLTIIANFSVAEWDFDVDELPFPEDGYSPFPWTYVFENRKLVIRDAKGKRIADRIFGKSVSDEQLKYINSRIAEGIIRLTESVRFTKV